MKLDPRTIVLILIIGSLLMSGGLFAVARGYLGAIRGLSQWAWATLVQAMGWVVFGLLRPWLPEWVSVVVGGVLIMVSIAMYLVILAEFNRKPVSMGWIGSVLAGHALLLSLIVLSSPNLAPRISLNSLVAAILMLQSVYVVWSGRDKRPPSHVFTAGLLLLCGGFLLFRTVYYLVWDTTSVHSQFLSSMINDISYLMFFITAVFLTFGFLLMCSERFMSLQKQAEKELRETNQRFAKLAAQVPGVICQYQLFPDGRACFPFASEGIRDIYEVSPAQVEHDAAPVMARVHPDDVGKVRASIATSAQTMQPWKLEYRVILAQGVRWCWANAHPEKLDDGSVLWHGFIADITDRALAQAKQQELEFQVRAGYDALRASEMRLRRLMNSSLIGIIQGRENGSLIEVNDVMLQMTGYTHAALTSGPLTWFDIIEASCRDTQRDTVAAMFSQGAGCQLETQLVAADRSLIPVMLGLAPLEGSRNEWVGFVVDLRAQRRIDLLQSEFISIVSHELRTPLTSIRGSLGLLEGSMAADLPPKVLQLIRIAHKNSRRLVSLVNDILDMEKLASGKMTLNLGSVDLVAIAGQTLEANAGYAQTCGVNFALHTSLAEARVVADPERLMQIFANLLSNAAKFSPPGGLVEIHIQAQGSRYRVEVVDHGKGIPAAFRERIFGRFAQADGTDSRNLDGAGLGLNITKTLVEKMGGEIGFDSVEGQGTTFWFVL